MGAWAQAIGSTYRLDGSGGVFGLTNTSAGVLGGIDRRWSNGVTAGAAFGYEGEDLSMGRASAKASGAAYFGALYGRWTAGRVFLDGQVFYMHSDWTVNRLVPGYGAAKSSPGGNSEGFLLQASAPIGDGDLRPYARVAYARFDRAGANETGVGGLGFAVSSATDATTLAEAGVMFAHSYDGGNGRAVRPALQLGFQGAYGDRAPEVSAGLSGIQSGGIAAASARVPQGAGVADASLELELSRSFELTGEVRGRFSENQTDVAASLGGRLRF
jgi:outer membrane autotransporter protein